MTSRGGRVMQVALSTHIPRLDFLNVRPLESGSETPTSSIPDNKDDETKAMKFCPNCAMPMVGRQLHGRERPACPACGFVHYAGPKVAVGVMLEREGRLVLGRRTIDPGKGRWSFPSGYVDLGESTVEAAAREVKEETGFDVVLTGLVGVYSTPSRPVVFIVYSGEIVGGAEAPCEEVEEMGLFEPGSLPPLAFDHDPEIVRDWLERRPGNGKI